MLKRLFEWFAALRRGEKRVAPAGVRGRVYQRPGDSAAIAVRTQPEATLSARIFRKDGTVEDLGVIARSKRRE